MAEFQNNMKCTVLCLELQRSKLQVHAGLCSARYQAVCGQKGGMGQTVHRILSPSGVSIGSIPFLADLANELDSINDHTVNVQPNRTHSTGSSSVAAMGHTTVTPNAPPIQSSISSTPNLVAATGLAKDCAGCGKRITERFLLKALDLFWHEDCLKCGCCDCRLGEVGSTLYTKANLILCKRDYLRLFGTTGYCAACNKVIPAFEMVMRAKNNVYHLECFAWASQGRPVAFISISLVPVLSRLFEFLFPAMATLVCHDMSDQCKLGQH
ncbi:hypothetical protein AND_001413 [Anopheles darlingi]|uniref:LIM zinc-binding domain-containing protein n=1 Tax=Anopheles darlingi TaxID=43151 RepID=W5JVF9_ANODA|nr:hypothetical protein AND_001413 [Anopheles darlingi]